MRVHGLVWMEFSSQPDLVKLKNSQSNNPSHVQKPTQPNLLGSSWVGLGHWFVHLCFMPCKKIGFLSII